MRNYGAASMANPSDEQAKQALAGVFSRASGAYDRVVTSFFDHFGSRLVDHVGLEPGWRVLDVGCGRGAAVFPASTRVGSAGRISGIDLAPGMVDVLRQEAEQRGIANVDVRVADAEDLPYPDGSFEAVLCGFALFFFPDSHKALSEFLRVVVPGGRLGVSTFTPAVADGLAWFVELLRDSLELPAPRRDTVQFDEPEQLDRALTSAGFTSVNVQEESFAVLVPSFDHFWEWMWSTGVRGLLEQLDEPATNLVRQAAEAHLDQELGSPPYHFTADTLLTRAVKP